MAASTGLWQHEPGVPAQRGHLCRHSVPAGQVCVDCDATRTCSNCRRTTVAAELIEFNGICGICWTVQGDLTDDTIRDAIGGAR